MNLLSKTLLTLVTLIAAPTATAQGYFSKITLVNPATTTLLNTGGFSDFRGRTRVDYECRIPTDSHLSITLMLTDFTPNGGPTLGGDGLYFDCAPWPAGTMITPCPNTVWPEANVDYGITHITSGSTLPHHATFFLFIHWTLPALPSYPTGSYTSTVIFTIATP